MQLVITQFLRLKKQAWALRIILIVSGIAVSIAVENLLISLIVGALTGHLLWRFNRIMRRQEEIVIDLLNMVGDDVDSTVRTEETPLISPNLIERSEQVIGAFQNKNIYAWVAVFNPKTQKREKFTYEAPLVLNKDNKVVLPKDTGKIYVAVDGILYSVPSQSPSPSSEA